MKNRTDGYFSVLATPETLPGFWIFMYRVSPFTYVVSGMLSVGLGNAHISCAPEEFLRFGPSKNMTCSNYLAPYVKSNGGYLRPDTIDSITECVFCTGSDTNTFLKAVSSEYADRWRNFGIFLVYILFNVFAAIGLYWLARVPKGTNQKNKVDTKDAQETSEKAGHGSPISRGVTDRP